MQASTVNLGIVLAVAAGLRLWMLGAGLPHDLIGDDRATLERVVAIMQSGDFNPHTAHSGGLGVYAWLPGAIVQFLAGAWAGSWSTVDLITPMQIALSGRLLASVLGTITVLLLYQIGARWGARHALLAAGLLAVSPLHVSASHFVGAEALSTFLVTLTMLLSIGAHERATSRAFVWPGVAAGLACSSTFTAAPALVVPLVAIWMTLHANPSRVRCLVVMLTAAAVAFFVTTPYAWLDLRGFLNGIAGAAASARLAPASRASPLLTGLGQLIGALGWPAFLLGIAGLVLGSIRAMKGPGRVRWTLAVTFCIVGFTGAITVGGARAAALLPVVPIVCLLAAVAVVSGVSLLRRFDIPRAPRRALIAALTVAALLPPLVRSIAFDHGLGARSQTSITPSSRFSLRGLHVGETRISTR
jgi:hypothetical protein